MHVHGSQMNMIPMNAYCAAAENALAAQRAADVRKKLAKRLASVEAAGNSDEAFMIGQWMEGASGPVPRMNLSEDEYHSTGKVPEFG
ncbi:MAG: hypothetical protein ABR923_12830 [Terracidiphilus sp.]|jgi:hypothetical protein